MRDHEFHRRVTELLERRAPFASARLLDVKGSVPREVGAGMIVYPDGRIESTIGGGRFEAMVTYDAVAMLERGERLALKEYALTRDELRMHCAGRAQVLIETHRPGPHLAIFGGGHVGRALGMLAPETGLFYTTLVDDRPEFASRDRHPRVDRVVLTDPSYKEGVPALDEATYAVIVTRCHAVDQALLRRLVPLPLPYLGLIGSRTKARSMLAELEAEGVPRERLERVRSPIGLPIGGKEPGAVAVSILAEVIQVLNERRAAEPPPPAEAEPQPDEAARENRS